MTKPLIGILDYGAGNTTSVKHSIYKLGYRSRLINNEKQFSDISMLLIPGVGAFPSAMAQLKELSLVEPVQMFSKTGKGVLGICLGMQLLADISYEQTETTGLQLIPGEVTPIQDPEWHIGWNSLETLKYDKTLSASNSQHFYFNHAYEFQTSEHYVMGITQVNRPIVSIVQKDNICGFQFHPEKSQLAGSRLLDNTIQGFLHA
jgi:glutamine amidotransferase